MNLNDSFIFSINKLNRSLIRKLDSHLAKHFLTTNQLFTLMAIFENPDYHMTELCRVLEADRTTLSRGAALLMRSNFVEIQKSKKDGRSHYLSLTKKGVDIIEKSIKILSMVDSDLRTQSRATLVLMGKKK